MSLTGKAYIYIISCEGHIISYKGHNYYKIGFTRQLPSLRLKALQTGVPFELELEFAAEVKSARETERVLHYFYLDKLYRGEWYDLTKAELNNLKKDIILWRDYDESFDYIKAVSDDYDQMMKEEKALVDKAEDAAGTPGRKKE